jgi:hypothetical protein
MWQVYQLIGGNNMVVYKFMFLIPNKIYIPDAMRSTLGVAVENHYGFAAILHQKLPPVTEYMTENLEWSRDLEGDAFCVVDTVDEEAKKYNVDEVGLTPITLEELSKKALEADYIIAYGLPYQLRELPSMCADSRTVESAKTE